MFATFLHRLPVRLPLYEVAWRPVVSRVVRIESIAALLASIAVLSAARSVTMAAASAAVMSVPVSIEPAAKVIAAAAAGSATCDCSAVAKSSAGVPEGEVPICPLRVNAMLGKYCIARIDASFKNVGVKT